MFAHKDFGEFSQEIGLASLGASEIEITRLAALYWFTIEFGMCKEDGQNKAYGAGLMSSVGELKYCCSDEPEFRPLLPYDVAQNYTEIPISKMQPVYFVADSFQKAKTDIIDYCNEISKPFNVTYNSITNTVECDRKIKTRYEVL